MNAKVGGGYGLLPFVLLCLTFTASIARCCTCGETTSAKTMRDVARFYSEGANAGRIIFAATIESQELVTGPISSPSNIALAGSFDPHRSVLAKVQHVYRGDLPPKITVLTGMGDGDCGLDFETGSAYLIYAEIFDTGKLFTTICMGTSFLRESGPQLRFLLAEYPTADDLLDVQSYYNKFAPLWTGTVSGRIAKAGGKPLAQASIELTQIRDEPFLPKSAAYSDVSKANGSFSIRYIHPGKYLLTADRLEVRDHQRWSGYFSGVSKQVQATTIEVRAGDHLTDIDFGVGKVRVHTLLFRIVTPDGRSLPLNRLGVSIDATDPDVLAYHRAQNRNVKGLFPAGFVPPGRSVVQTYIRPDPNPAKIPPALSRWLMIKKEIGVSSDSEVVLTLSPAN
jgi:hypothetical protein